MRGTPHSLSVSADMTVGYATDTEEVEDGMKTPTGEPAADAALESTPPATTGADGVMTEPAVLEPEVRLAWQTSVSAASADGPVQSPEDVSDTSDHDSALGVSVTFLWSSGMGEGKLMMES